MAGGIFTRTALDKIQNNADLTAEQKVEQIFGLYGRALDDGYVSKTAAEEAKNAAIEEAKKAQKAPDPVDPKTTPEYMEVANERDMLRAIGGEEYQTVKPKFREQVYGMIDRGEKAKPVPDQLAEIKGKYEEFFFPENSQQGNQQKNKTPQFSQQAGRQNTNPESEEDKIVAQLSKNW